MTVRVSNGPLMQIGIDRLTLGTTRMRRRECGHIVHPSVDDDPDIVFPGMLQDLGGGYLPRHRD